LPACHTILLKRYSMDYFKKVTFRMTYENIRELKAYLALLDISMQDFINMAIKEKLDRDLSPSIK